MKDYEKLITLLKEFGIEAELDEDNNIFLVAGSQEKIKGYSMFHVIFNFDEDGKFKNMGIWE